MLNMDNKTAEVRNVILINSIKKENKKKSSFFFFFFYFPAHVLSMFYLKHFIAAIEIICEDHSRKELIGVCDDVG